MTSIVVKLPGEPIVLVTIRLPFEDNLETIRSARSQISNMTAELGKPMYALLDARALEVSFSDILLFIDEYQNKPPRPAAPPTYLVLVGTHPLLATAARKFEQTLGLNTSLFATLDEALLFARAQAGNMN